MGRRSAGAAKSAPVGLPHDGLLALLAKTSSSDVEDAAGSGSFDDGAQLLLSAAREQPINDHDDLQDLLFQLQTATHVHEQLQTLQRCRSQWASSQSAINQQQRPASNQPRQSQDKRLLLLLYRILLEWMLSTHTPVPLRRAIASFLSGVEQRLALPRIVNERSQEQQEEEDSTLLVIVVILQSILNSSSSWKDPLHSLQELLSWLSPNHDLCWSVLDMVSPAQILLFLAKKSHELIILGTNAASSASSTNNNNTEIMAKLIDKTILLHLQLNQQQSKNDNVNLHEQLLDLVVVNDLREFLWQSLSTVNANQLLSLGVALGRSLQSSCCDAQDNNEQLLALLQASRKRAALLSSDVQRAAVLQGLVMVVPIPSDVNNNTDNNEDKNTTMMEELMNDCQQLVERATDPEIRLLALKGMRASLSRINTVLDDNSNNDETIQQQHLRKQQLTRLVQQRLAPATLETILQAWENPQTRKLANAIPALFDSLIRLMLKLQQHLENDDGNSTFFAELVGRLLAQPPHRKGRYLALETLLPITGARALLGPSPNKQKQDTSAESPSSTFSALLLRDLMNGMGDQGHNTGVIADLWSKLLQQLLVEMTNEIDDSDMGSKEQGENGKSHSTAKREIPEEWTNIWVPSLASALVCIELSRRRQVAAFCLPRIGSVIGGTSGKMPKRSELSHLFGALLHETESLRLLSPTAVGISLSAASKSRETFDDRILWAELEIIRYASQYHLLKPADSSLSANVFCCIAAKILPFERLRCALVHSSPTIRVAAMQVMDSVIATYVLGVSSAPNTLLESSKRELELWKYALQFAVKTDGKEYISSVLLCLIRFLDRLSLVEATNCGTRNGEHKSNPSLPILHSFMVDFLVGDLFVIQTAYPGTAACKEAFALALLECVLVFASRNHPFALDSKLLQKTSPIYNRKRLDAEAETLSNVQKALLDREVIGSLLSLLHSNWDHTRPTCFRLLAGLVVVSQVCTIPLPTEISDPSARRNMESRALFLASSPRQREADTGARILAFLYLSAPSAADKRVFLGRLVDLLDRRLTAMKVKLLELLSDKASILGGQQLPLAHGIVQALRVILEEDQHFLLIEDDFKHELVAIFDRTFTYFCRALKVTLAVVADIKDGEEMEGIETEMEVDANPPVTSKTIVNPSAIGANGIFSSIHRSSKEEDARRQASQRIVVGSWLLTKETCLALAALITQPGYVTGSEVRDEAGIFLINTLTSLKHTGAAFAAHRAIQQIAQSCFLAVRRDSALQQLPKQWADRLLREVSEKEKIRDSTLRRSLGYSLGFIALQRAEISSRPSPRPLCRLLLTELVKMALPPRREVYAFSSKIALDEEMTKRLFTLSLEGKTFEFLVDDSLESRTRVHALNALRHILLDAPLSQENFPYVGLAIIASVIGYTDFEWSIRNSSTMLFAAAMLRSVDSDKNAANKDTTSSKAISLQELFQAYPALDSFLLAVLKHGVQEFFVEAHRLSLPPFLPILLLLVRVQSVSLSGKDSAILAKPFVPTILECIKHRNLSVRKAAARALRNLACDDPTSATSIVRIMEQCQREVSFAATHGGTGDFWNSLHGSLLSIQEFVAHSEKAATIVRESTTIQDLLHISKVQKESTILVPPPCISVAIDILSLVGVERRTLIEACLSVIFWCECRTARHMDQIGGADLAATAARVGARTIAKSLWNDSSSAYKVYFTQLDSLFNSNVIDIRLAAAKAFKKSIYNGLDRVSAREKEHGLTASLMIVLLKALTNELARDSNATDVGAHPPTLRRISRCLIETIDALLQIGTHHAGLEFTEELRKLARAILRRGQGSLTVLDGNGVELLSFGFAQDPEHNDEYLLYQNLIRMSDPYCDWRVRHSASVTLEMSKAFSSAVSENSFLLWQSWARLMQDDDIDVRYAAARASSEQPNQLLQRCVSEVTLLDRHDRACNNIPEEKRLVTLFAELYNPSEHLGEKLDTVVDEYMRSQDVSDKRSCSLLNIESNKIFLDEPPNAYKEKSLSGQLAAIEIARRGFSHENDLSTTTSQILTCTCRVLSMIPSRTKNADMLHDVTRHSTIFPSLHNLLLGAIGCILLLGDRGYDKDIVERLQRLASDIVGESASIGGAITGVSVMHPCILKAIKTLAFAKPGNESTIEALRECCFLVPLSG